MKTEEPQLIEEVDLKCCHPGDTFRLELGSNPLERNLLITVEDPHKGLIQLQRQSGLTMRVTVGSNVIEAKKSFVVKVGPANSRDGHVRLGYISSIVRAGTVKLGKPKSGSKKVLR